MQHSHSFLRFALAASVAFLGPASGARAQDVTVSGVLNAIWGDVGPDLEADHPTQPEYLLMDGSGMSFALDGVEKITRAEGGPFRFNRKEVVVQGLLDPDTERIQVRSIVREPEPPEIFSHLLGSHVVGPQRWLTILCRFGDATGVTPEPASFFDDLMDLMDVFWRELSYDTINLTGSRVVGWVNMPQNRAAYLDDPTTHFGGHTLNFAEIAQDCADAANAADASLHFPDFDGINFAFNQDLDCCSWGGSATLTLDGMTKTYSTTFMATWGWGNQDVMGQEMGHGFGLPHSSGPYTATYDSRWDVMSAGGTCSPPDVDFGCLGVHTVGFHKDALGWIPPARRYLATAAADQFVTLERLALPGAGGFLVAQIPIGGSSTHFYTVEARKFAGFDDQVPGEAVVIHEVDTTLGDRNAQVVDVDAVANTNPNDVGARWLPGEVFEDAANGIRVAILSMSATGFEIVINPSNLVPMADAGPDRLAECTSPTGAPVTLDGTGSSDPDGDPLTFAWSAPGIVFDDATSSTPTATFPQGITTVTLTVSDSMESDSDTADVTVIDTTPPLITCPADLSIECNAAGGVPASDPAIAAFLAGASAADACDPAPLVAAAAPAFFPLGTTVVSFTATDASANAALCQAAVTVVDSTPPVIAASVSPTLLWPPNHRLVDISADVIVSDVCDPSPTFALTAATSSEPADHLGDGSTAVDIVGASLGTADLALQLRAERSGRGPGRVYTVEYTASDASGNTASASAEVRVPHRRP